MEMREVLARAQAEAEDVTRTIMLDDVPLRLWLQRRNRFQLIAERCEFKKPNGGQHVICLHESHEAHATGISACNEEQCPLLEAMKV